MLTALRRSCQVPPHSRMQSTSSLAPTTRKLSSKPKLPRLPVPKLEQTLQRYLKSLEPFLLEDDARGGEKFEDAFARRVRWAEDFVNGLGLACQTRLQALDRASPNNWLDDNIWLKKAYHEYREPVLINSNWWVAFVNDPNIPQDVLLGATSSIGQTGITPWQVRRAAWLTHRLLDFKEQLQRQEIYPDSTKIGIWFRTSTDRIFNTARLPRPKCDTFSTLPSPTDPSARSILLSVHDWLYAVEVIEQDGRLIPARELETRLRSVIADVQRRLSHGELATPISVLTADHRDRWAESQSYLLSLSPQNHDTLNAINHSMICLSLDAYTYTLPSDSSSSYGTSLLPEPDSQDEVDAHLHNLRSSHSDRPARNRWHDKPLTLIVESNTRAGAAGEHSPVDALVPSLITEYAVVQGIEEVVLGGPLPSTFDAIEPTVTNAGGWKRLDWVVDERIQRECQGAEERARTIVRDSDDCGLWFTAYGAEWIKSEAGLSPDAYIQMALQLAWYRTRGFFTATYETALTRIFHHGRTETIRTLSSASREWVLAMDNPSTSAAQRLSLLKEAVNTHTSLTRAASTGKGVDRHLLGLRCMLQPNETHLLFSDELFTRSQTWKLSTSGLSAGHQFRGTGFGSSEHDGYGVNYLAGPDALKFGIESKHSCPQTSTLLFKQALHDALIDIRTICITGGARSHL